MMRWTKLRSAIKPRQVCWFSSTKHQNAAPLVALNSLTGQLDPFPSSPTAIKWYVCGPTVYDSAHLGHARSYVSQDILRRILTKHFGQEVFLVMGMTDVDDKIIASAAQKNQPFEQVARHYEAAYLRDLASLNVLRVSAITRVSEHISDIIAYVQGLEANNFAYTTSDGVYFDTVAMGSAYGKLAPSAATADDYADADVEEGSVGSEKRNVRDFALWKFSKTPEEPGWTSPWGRGRPGWHIECSAMTHHVLGDSIDVHSGGIDLRFPHHNNEIAQCDGFHHHKPGHNWCGHFVHFGHLYIKGLKMSKSLKNFITIDALLKEYTADAFRLFCLQYKYNVNVHFSDDRMRDANAVLQRFHSFLQTIQSHLRANEATFEVSKRMEEEDHELLAALAQCKASVDAALRQDFDTPTALQALLDLISTTNKAWKERPQIPDEVLSSIATYVMQVLDLFGIESLQYRSIQLAVASSSDAQTSAINSTEILDIFTQFRAQVRQLALTNTSDKVAQGILQLCDQVRNEVLPRVGVRLEDLAPGKSFWKHQPWQEAPTESADDGKAAEKALLAAKAAEFEAEMQIAPVDFFKLSAQFQGKFLSFDESGTPTHDGKGEELTKSARKKLAKKLEKHSKSYEKYWSNR
ncbi:hypothetical protein LEN26_010952 [Aphanomyces euteiches]|nr:hypothetical protein LEN26_010952 [Aphanomyces euteiches]